MTNGIEASRSSETMNVEFGTVNPWYYPVTPSSYSFHNPNFYHPPEYTPPPTPPHVFHSPQPPPYYTPPTPYTSPYLPNSSEIPSYSTYQHEIQARQNPYHPPLICFPSPFITTTQFPFGVIDEQQPELVVSQVFDESAHSPELISNYSNDNYHQMDDKFTEIIQKLEEMGKNLADRSRISKEMSSKKVSQSSHTLTHVPIVSNLDKSDIIEKTGNVDSKQQLDILAPHMFDESPEKEYVTLDKQFHNTLCTGQIHSDVESKVVETSVKNLKYANRVFDVNSGRNVHEGSIIMKSFSDDNDVSIGDEGKSEGIVNEVWKEFVDEKGSDCTFEECDNDSETSKEVADSTVGELDFTERDESNSGVLVLDNVFDEFDSFGFENEREIELKDIKDRKILKTQFSLALSSVKGESARNEGGGIGGKVSEFRTLKEEVKDGDLNVNGEKNAFEGVSAEHGSGRKITNDCSHFITQIGDLKSIKKIYGRMCDTYLCSWNLTITRYSKIRNMESARSLFDDSSGKKFVPKKEVCFESNSIMLLSILNVSSHGGMKGNGDTNQNGKGLVAVNIKVSDSHVVAETSCQVWIVTNVGTFASDARVHHPQNDAIMMLSMHCSRERKYEDSLHKSDSTSFKNMELDGQSDIFLQEVFVDISSDISSRGKELQIYNSKLVKPSLAFQCFSYGSHFGSTAELWLVKKDSIPAGLMFDVSSSKGVVYENICSEPNGVIFSSNYHACSFDDNSRKEERVVRRIMMTGTGHVKTLLVASEDPDIDHEPISGKLHELNFKSKPYVLAYLLGMSERGRMHIEIRGGSINLPGSTKSESSRLTGQFRGKTELASAKFFLGSRLLFRSIFDDHNTRKRCSNCKMIFFSCNSLGNENENVGEACCDDCKLDALLLLNKNVADRKLYDESLQFMVQMVQGASDFSAELEITMQLKVLVVLRMVFFFLVLVYYKYRLLVFDPCDSNGYTVLQITFILEDKDDFEREVLLRIGSVRIRSYLMGQGHCWARLRISQQISYPSRNSLKAQ